MTTTTDNRFAPPRATVADIGEASTQPIRLWPPSGRMGRLRLLAYSLGIWLAYAAFSFVIGLVTAAVRLPGAAVIALQVVGLAVYVFAAMLLLIQRSHDMNLSGWWSIAAFIPLVGLVWVFKGGSRGANDFGPPPLPNTVAITILGLLFPAIAAIGILAAIALPAYQSYTLKAKAAAGR